jgi:hypothetical protein
MLTSAWTTAQAATVIGSLKTEYSVDLLLKLET